jgi:2',3'-cyclic-nucleotide 2'-phosphodiesterase (5'-nucleotidase family)
MMAEQGYAGVNVGAEELGLGADLLRSFAAEKTFPLVSSNLADERTGKLVFPDARIVRVAGARVAVTGVTRPPPELADSVKASGLTFRDPQDALERVLRRLDREADIVVLLANLPES